MDKTNLVNLRHHAIKLPNPTHPCPTNLSPG